MAGAKGKYGKAIIEKICECIIEGATARSTCNSVGIDESTYYEWLNTKPEFSEAIKKAGEIRDNLTGKTLAINSIFRAMESGTWTAGAWWLERKFPAEFRNVQEVRKDYDYEAARKELEKLINNTREPRKNDAAN